MASNTQGAMCNGHLSVISYNCKHFNSNNVFKIDFIENLMLNVDFMFLQEHWLYKSQFDKLQSICNGVNVIATSSMDESAPRAGRPYGGCAILWKQNLVCKYSEITCGNPRLCALRVEIDNCVFILINCYMPCDSQSQDGSHELYIELLNEIQQIYVANSPCELICGGDFNTEFTRQSQNSMALANFVQMNDFTVCWDLAVSQVPYTYCNFSSGSTSVIDHFFVSPRVGNLVKSVSVIDNNLHSDHLPVKLVVEMDVKKISLESKGNCKRIAWYKATQCDLDTYKEKLSNILNVLQYDNDIFTCTNNQCKTHVNEICRVYNKFINAINHASDCLPKTGQCPKNGKVLPGWKEFVEPSRREALYWHWCWKQQGKPHHGEVAEFMRMSRALYHKNVRMVVKHKGDIAMERMAEALTCNKMRDFWSEVKKIKGRNNVSSSTIDCESDENNIAQVFSNKYKQLYNSVPYNSEEMSDICSRVENLIEGEQCNYIITTNEVEKAVKSLKYGKFGGDGENLSSDHFVHAPRIMLVFLSLFYNSMLVHGISPNSMILGTMVPIPKCKQKRLDVSDNYRSITLSSIVSKIFDIIVLSRDEKLLMTSELQFGFKQASSTTQCTFNLIETIQYYNFQHSDVHVLLLDATKAFDRVEYCRLFNLLLERNVSPLVIRLLLFMYTEQSIQVKWKSTMSEAFNVKNGVKQGANLSPILFSIYIDGLLCQLKRAGIGCHIGKTYVGCLAYADDIVLLCPTNSGLQKMLNRCLKYAKSYNILFNGLKSQYLIFNGRNNCELKSRLSVDGVEIENVKNTMYLGHKLEVGNYDSLVSDANAKFWKSFNGLMADFGHIKSDLLCKLFKQNCCYYYGAPLWLLNSNCVEKINVSWRKAVRCIFRIPNRTHNFMLHHLTGTAPFIQCLEKRFIKFINSIILKPTGDVTKYIMENTLNNPMSIFRQNFVKLQKMYKLSVTQVNDLPEKSDEVDTLSSVLIELIEVRDGIKQCDVFSREHLIEFITTLCTMQPP